jgi:amiloride-sensitive sodium channel subunit alpha
VTNRSFQFAFYDEFIKGKSTFGTNFDVYSELENNDNLTALQKLEKLDSMHLIEQNFLRLKVVLEDRGVETYNSTPSLTWEGLASNIGGSLSLWIGITVMTLFEFVELVVRLVQLCLAPRNLTMSVQSRTRKIIRLLRQSLLRQSD